MVAGVASRLSPQMLKGSQRTRAELQSMWQETVGRSFSHAAASFASTGMLRNDTATPIIAVWPVYYGGTPGVMMQELHLIRLWSEQSHHSTTLPGVASASLVVMDVVSLKCQGQWSRAAKALGGPEVLSTSSCMQSIAAVHTASAEAPLPLLLVGRADVSVQVDDTSFLASMSQSWRDLALHPPAAASPQPVAMAAFGSWWPALQLLWAEAGALVACEYGTSTESCLWATIARSTAELRPWEDFVGSDSTSLMSATMLLGWLAQEQVVFCEDWEDEETGATKCACGYLILDRGNLELPADARQRLADTLEPIAADELFESSEDRSDLSQSGVPVKSLMAALLFVTRSRCTPFDFRAMLDLITILSAAGLQQELKTANGDKSLVIREEEEEASFVESAAGHVSTALESFDDAVAQGWSALFGNSESSAEMPPQPKKVE
ncbi:unnamed protein product [Symbiodinium sp. KB8]|nr:unnamed protein product [Symbiodinium sp. KB8]